MKSTNIDMDMVRIKEQLKTINASLRVALESYIGQPNTVNTQIILRETILNNLQKIIPEINVFEHIDVMIECSDQNTINWSYYPKTELGKKVVKGISC